MNERTDILLINPFSWTRAGNTPYLPYGILYLASYLRVRGISVDVFEANADLSDPLDIIGKKQPLAIGLSVLTGPVIKEALKISTKTKSKFKDIKIIWGGLHPTLFPEYVLKEESIDFVIQGEGEEPLFRLIDSLIKNNFDKSISSLGYKEGKKIFVNPISSKTIDLNNSPMPAWDLVDVPKYIANRFFANRVLTINSSRGCPFKCAFCFNQGLPGQSWRGLNAGKIYEQIVYLRETYKINGVQFYEDSFDTNKKRVKEFCQLMINNRIKVSWSHFSNIIYCNEEMLRIEREAKCKYIEYGVESGSEKILKMVNKSQSVEAIENTFATCKKVGIRTAALFMIGYPSETMKELRETIDLVERLPAHILICTIYRPYPGTPLHEYCIKNNNFTVPISLEEQAEFYKFSHMKADTDNMSEVPTEYLLRLQRSFYAKFAIKEAILCLRELNFGLLFYYLKLQIRPKAFLYTVKSLLNRISFIFRRISDAE